jgi:hypothetical protein
VRPLARQPTFIRPENTETKARPLAFTNGLRSAGRLERGVCLFQRYLEVFVIDGFFELARGGALDVAQNDLPRSPSSSPWLARPRDRRP